MGHCPSPSESLHGLDFLIAQELVGCLKSNRSVKIEPFVQYHYMQTLQVGMNIFDGSTILKLLSFGTERISGTANILLFWYFTLRYLCFSAKLFEHLRMLSTLNISNLNYQINMQGLGT